jgi:hypothetical protein
VKSNRVLLVGEHNPYRPGQAFALYPHPERSAGHRLCVDIMRMRRAAYLRNFDRLNLCVHRAWDVGEARERALSVVQECANDGACRSYWRTIVLLGSRVCGAFDVPFVPFVARRMGALPGPRNKGVLRGSGAAFDWVVILPHPSGRSRLWNEAGAIGRARAALWTAGVIGEW